MAVTSLPEIRLPSEARLDDKLEAWVPPLWSVQWSGGFAICPPHHDYLPRAALVRSTTTLPPFMTHRTLVMAT